MVTLRALRRAAASLFGVDAIGEELAEAAARGIEEGAAELAGSVAPRRGTGSDGPSVGPADAGHEEELAVAPESAGSAA